MFKKRTRPAAVRDKATIDEEISVEEASSNVASGSGTTAVEEDEGQSIEELILLRKLRKSQPGIDLEKLNRGEQIKQAKIDAAAKYGLQSVKGKGRAEEGEEDDKERAKRLVRSNNFTQQTNALDVDKHMLAYIEEELSKRRGNTIREGEEVEKIHDPVEGLYSIPEKYMLSKRKDDEEGSVTNSLGMLTAIPEVDLGMDNRLRNIEATERAKREMMEMKKTLPYRRKAEDEDFASARFSQQKHRIASDVYAAEEAKREAAKLLNAPPPKPRMEPGQRFQNQTATDEQVYDRFKKRMKR